MTTTETPRPQPARDTHDRLGLAFARDLGDWRRFLFAITRAWRLSTEALDPETRALLRDGHPIREDRPS